MLFPELNEGVWKLIVAVGKSSTMASLLQRQVGQCNTE